MMQTDTANSYVAGFFDGEGSLTRSKTAINLTVSNQELAVLNFYQRCLKHSNFAINIYKYSYSSAYQGRLIGGARRCLSFLNTIPFQSERKQSKAYLIFEEFNQKFIPQTELDPSWYLAGFFDAEGSISLHNRWASVSNLDAILMERVQTCFLKLEIRTSLRNWKTPQSRDAYKLCFLEQNLEKIPFQSPKHHERLRKPKRSWRGNEITSIQARDLYQKGLI